MLKSKMPNQEYIDHVRNIAHQIWLDEGQSNGEEYLNTWFGPMKLKDIHWFKAKCVADLDLQIIRDISILDETYHAFQ